MDDACTVTFEGDQGGTYYVACNLVEYIDNESLVNTGNTTIYLYSDIQQGTNSASISIPAFSYPRYYSGNQYRYITNAYNISFNSNSSYYRDFDLVEIVLISIIASISFIRLLLPRR